MTDLYQMKIRLNPELKSFIQCEAKLNYRTMNAQILFFLQQIKESKHQDIKQ